MRDQYASLYNNFRWHVPADFNIAQAVCTRWARDKKRVALIEVADDGSTRTCTYAQLQSEANRLSNLFATLGIKRGARVAIMLPQRREAAVAHVAAYQSALIAMPMSVLFGPEALEYRLNDSAAEIALVDAQSWAQLESARAACGHLKHIVCVDGLKDAALLDYTALVSAQSERYAAQATRADDAALLIYTSGTTGPPKGALKAHRALIGNLPGFVASQNWFPKKGDVFWSPADWAWTGGLMDALLPTLYFGCPIVASMAKTRERFDAHKAFALIEAQRVTNAFLFPTALKMMMKAVPEPRKHYQLRLRAIMSAGESVGAAVFEWAEQQLNVTVNEMFGQTEINYVVGNSAKRWPAKPGSIGRPYPGHRVAVIDEAGQEVTRGVAGEVAVHRFDIHGTPDPVFFLGYWNNEAATQKKYSGDWCRTGDEAVMDADGYLWYQGRADDMFKAAGYRIGPSEVENCLLRHAAVANAAVVPKPDAERGNLIKAYVVLTEGHRVSDALVDDLKAHVRARLAAYEVPREFEFVAQLPMTTTGKVQRRVLRLAEEERARAKQRGAA